MPGIIDILARLRFQWLAFKHCVIKKSNYEGQYARKMDFQGLDIKSQMIDLLRAHEDWATADRPKPEHKVAFIPFEIQIGSGMSELFQTLGRPHFADTKTHRTEGLSSAHYKLQVGSLKCRLSIYFFENKIVFIKTKLSADRYLSSAESPDIISLLFGHRLPERLINDCAKGAFVRSTDESILRIERRTYDCQVIAFNPQSQGLKNLIKEKVKKSTDPKTNCQVQNWYRKKFGTYSQVES